MEEQKPKKPRKPGSGKAPKPNNKNLPQNQKGYREGLIKQAEPSWEGIKADITLYNPMQNLTIAQMADKINEIDPKRKATKYANFILAVRRISEGVNIKDVEDMRRRFYAYVSLCEATSMKVGNINSYSAIGIPHQLAYMWKNGQSTVERQRLIEEIDMVCSGYREQLIADQQINPVTGIFWQKNWDGLRDVQEHSVVAGDPLGERRSSDDIKRQYEDIIEE